MTKFLTTLLGLSLLLSACSDYKTEEKDAMNEVIKVHDEAMEKSEKVVHNNILLDSLIKTKAVDSVQASAVTKNLSAADKAMEDWMHQFEVERDGKSHEQVMQYMANQKKQISTVNQQLDAAIKQSNQFISTLKK
ncbi:hypothetical protein [Mucilaginibacter terrae]|uniref:DsDNA-binding SOS-regulon protein n=1 Tax=Mucilaginibacter terrae TaxID=1955052 RepID=A0ABU3H0X8_9SPHI|nr:hypothetical protein [Mucilaginibacter terrae]MDT3405677.1 dsDNA-binding SOS-regulon protein [Mucilaginibacter terrae]